MSIEIRQLDEGSLQPAFDLAIRVFAGASTLHRALNAGLDEYRDHLRGPFRSTIGEGLSVVAIERGSGDLVGCLIATDYRNHTTGGAGEPLDFGPISALSAALFRQYRRQRTVGSGEVVLVDMAAVAKDAHGKGVYQRMRSAAHDLARNRGYFRVVGELSSTATQHVVLDRLGHRNAAEVAFATFEYEGKRPFRSIDKPPSIILAEGEL